MLVPRQGDHAEDGAPDRRSEHGLGECGVCGRTARVDELYVDLAGRRWQVCRACAAGEP